MMNTLSSSSTPSKWSLQVSPEREGVQLQTPQAGIPFAPFVGLQLTPATRQQICKMQTFPKPFTLQGAWGNRPTTGF